MSARSTNRRGAPRISAVMAACDAEGTIAAAVRSVFEQSHPVHELIVVDDGSSDTTTTVLQALAEPRLRLLRQPNRGPSAARNAAIAVATGDYIACIDSDDHWHPDKLAQQIARLQDEPSARVCYGWTDRVDTDGRRVHPDQRAGLNGDVHRHLLAGNFIMSGSNTLIERDALLSVGGFDETLRRVEDWDLHVRLAARFAFVSTGTVVVDYRLTPGSLSSDVAGMEAAFVRARDGLFAALRPAEPRLRRRCTASFYRYLSRRTLQGGRSRERLLASQGYALAALRAEPLNVPGNLRMLAALALARVV